MIRILPAKSIDNSSLALEWDAVASERDAQIRSGADKSFDLVLLPTMLRLAGAPSIENSILDVGCGTGVLSESLADMGWDVTGVDISPASLDIARNSALNKKRIRYFHSSIESFAKNKSKNYSIIVANMVLQDVADIGGAISALGGLSKIGSRFIGSITHPCFWPLYWGYSKREGFDYGREYAVQAPFKISGQTSDIGVTTHFHRPLEKYCKAFDDAGFSIEKILEPYPIGTDNTEYVRSWKFPRFMFFVCEYRGTPRLK